MYQLHRQVLTIFSTPAKELRPHNQRTEFLAATLETQGSIEEYRLLECFDQMDIDGSGKWKEMCSQGHPFISSISTRKGYISRENLRDLLGKHSTEEFIDSLMDEADIKKDGRISYEEFYQVVSLGHKINRESVAKIYDESDRQLSVVLEEDVEVLEEIRSTDEVLRKHGLSDALKFSIGNLRTKRMPTNKDIK